MGFFNSKKKDSKAVAGSSSMGSGTLTPSTSIDGTLPQMRGYGKAITPDFMSKPQPGIFVAGGHLEEARTNGLAITPDMVERAKESTTILRDTKQNAKAYFPELRKQSDLSRDIAEEYYKTVPYVAKNHAAQWRSMVTAKKLTDRVAPVYMTGQAGYESAVAKTQQRTEISMQKMRDKQKQFI